MRSKKLRQFTGPASPKKTPSSRSNSILVDSSVCAGCFYQSTCLAAELVNELAKEGCPIHSNSQFLKAKYKVGEPLFRVSTAFDALFMILSGSAKSSWLDESGNEQIVGLYIPGDLVGLDAISPGFHPSSAIILEESYVCRIPFYLFESGMTAAQRVKRTLIRQASRALRLEQFHSLSVRNKTADQRIAIFMSDLIRRLENRSFASDRIVLSLSRRDIGNYLGLALGTVSRSFSRLQDAGVITVHHREVVIHEAARLADLAGKG